MRELPFGTAMVAHLRDLQDDERDDVVFMVDRVGERPGARSTYYSLARAKALAIAIHDGYVHARVDDEGERDLECTLRRAMEQTHLVDVLVAQTSTRGVATAAQLEHALSVVKYTWTPVVHAIGLDGAPRGFTANERTTIAELRAFGEPEVLGDWLEVRGLQRV